MTVDDVLGAVETFAPAALDELFGKLLCMPCIPVASLIKLGEDVVKTIEARNELAAMKAAVSAADAAADAAEEASLQLKPTGGI